MAATAALGLTAGLSGCGGNTDAESGRVSLTVVATNYGDSVHKTVAETDWSEVATAIRARIGKAVTPNGNPRAVLESIAKAAK